jgi:hypothetical protein
MSCLLSFCAATKTRTRMIDGAIDHHLSHCRLLCRTTVSRESIPGVARPRVVTRPPAVRLRGLTELLLRLALRKLPGR